MSRQRPGGLSVGQVGVREALGRRRIGARQQCDDLIALSEQGLDEIALGRREHRLWSIEFRAKEGGSESASQGVGVG